MILRVLALLCVPTALILGEYFASQTSLHFALPTGEELPHFDWLKIFIEAGALLAGIAFGHVYHRLQDLKARNIETISVSAELRGMLASTSFYLALAASPILFGIVVTASSGLALPSATLLSFQNGFFWQSVMPKNAPVAGSRP